MTVISTTKDADALTMTVVADLDASIDRVWQLWEDPRQLEQWWGPPTWPATFDRHDFVVGGQSRYHMTGPDGERAPGWWRIMLAMGMDEGLVEAMGQIDPLLATGPAD
ncbi:SRPBCC family protein [Sanguibacter suarezii]|uniref:SRPBCC family protein n=1 Tax=Sanguibacter suarezii TaxID=60921 RepID=UPI00082F47D0|nr:SRPBCC domain-containing protein [Sanguibacter suarezii]